MKYEISEFNLGDKTFTLEIENPNARFFADFPEMLKGYDVEKVAKEVEILKKVARKIYQCSNLKSEGFDDDLCLLELPEAFIFMIFSKYLLGENQEFESEKTGFNSKTLIFEDLKGNKYTKEKVKFIPALKAIKYKDLTSKINAKNPNKKNIESFFDGVSAILKNEVNLDLPFETGEILNNFSLYTTLNLYKAVSNVEYEVEKKI